MLQGEAEKGLDGEDICDEVKVVDSMSGVEAPTDFIKRAPFPADRIELLALLARTRVRAKFRRAM
jgi:hypothetical protein